MKSILTITFLICCTFIQAQRYEYVYRQKNDSAVNCYLKIIPSSKKIKGLIVRDYSSLPDSKKKSPYNFQALATKNDFITLYTVTSKSFPEMFYADSCMQILDTIISEVVKAHDIPLENIFIGGISASGARALRYAQFCEQGKSAFGHKIKGVFSVDSPLDLSRFYYSVKLHKSNFKEGMKWEADLMEKVFPEKLGGSPTDFPERYRNASVFSQTDSLGGNAYYLKDVNLILFHEPDIDWWLHERGCSYYDFNSYDIAAFVVKLKAMGSKKVELVTTTGKGFDNKGNRNCHSWTIVDEDYLMKWIVSKCGK